MIGHYDWPLCVDCMLKSSRGKAQWLSNDYSILTEDERKCAAHQYGCLWCSSAWSQRVLKGTRYGSPRCEHFGFSIHVTFLEVGKCSLRLLHTFYFFPHGFLSFIEINFDFHKVGRDSMRYYFRSRSTMQVPSTEYNFRPRSTTSVNICFTPIPHSLLSAWIS